MTQDYHHIVHAITISGYKSIRFLHQFPLRNLNVLIGANGSGKSNFIGLFRLLNAMYEQQLADYVSDHGGPDAFLHFGRKTTPRLHSQFFFGVNGYKFWLKPTTDNIFKFESEESWYGGTFKRTSKTAFLGRNHRESKLKEATDDYSPYVRESVSKWRVYHFHDTSDTATVKGKHAVNDNLLLKPDAANLAPYLRRLHKRHESAYRRILDTIRLVAPFFGDFVHRPDEEEYIELEWTQRGQPDTPFKAHLLSDGTLRFICLVTLLLQPVELLPDTILIDEPELGLHPFAISVLADIFKQVAEKRQLIVSTQSVELVNELTPEDVIVVDLEDGASTFRRFTGEELEGWLSEYAMGELWKRNVLGGRP